MQPRQIRDTSRPVRPSYTYFMTVTKSRLGATGFVSRGQSSDGPVCDVACATDEIGPEQLLSAGPLRCVVQAFDQGGVKRQLEGLHVLLVLLEGTRTNND